jgi:hypothetical protein
VQSTEYSLATFGSLSGGGVRWFRREVLAGTKRDGVAWCLLASACGAALRAELWRRRESIVPQGTRNMVLERCGEHNLLQQFAVRLNRHASDTLPRPNVEMLVGRSQAKLLYALFTDLNIE